MDIAAQAKFAVECAKAGWNVVRSPRGTIRIDAAQALGEHQEEAQEQQPPQPEPEAATVDGPPPAPDSDNEGNEDPVPDADEAAPHRDGDAPPAEDDVSLPPIEVEGTRKQKSTIEGANALLAKGLKVELNSAKIEVLRKAVRLWGLSNPRVTIKCNSAKIDVVEAALALGIDKEHITLKTADLAVAEEAEAKGLLPENRIRIRTKTGSVSLAEFRRRRTSKRAKLDAAGAETHQERQPLGEIQDVGLPAQSLRHPS